MKNEEGTAGFRPRLGKGYPRSISRDKEVLQAATVRPRLHPPAGCGAHAGWPVGTSEISLPAMAWPQKEMSRGDSLNSRPMLLNQWRAASTNVMVSTGCRKSVRRAARSRRSPPRLVCRGCRGAARGVALGFIWENGGGLQSPRVISQCGNAILYMMSLFFRSVISGDLASCMNSRASLGGFHSSISDQKKVTSAFTSPVTVSPCG